MLTKMGTQLPPRPTYVEDQPADPSEVVEIWFTR
jgi:hypothetical protein